MPLTANRPPSESGWHDTLTMYSLCAEHCGCGASQLEHPRTAPEARPGPAGTSGIMLGQALPPVPPPLPPPALPPEPPPPAPPPTAPPPPVPPFCGAPQLQLKLIAMRTAMTRRMERQRTPCAGHLIPSSTPTG